MRIVIAEDSAVIRAGLARLLSYHGHTVVAEAGRAEELWATVAEHLPDLAVVDIRMPPSYTDEGLRAAIAVRETHPGVGILVFSQYVETRYATELLTGDPGGVGYLLKDRVSAVEDFLDALDRVAAGGTALDPEVVAQLMRAGRRRDPLAVLTEREREVLALMAEGRSNAAVARLLRVGDRAVEKHVSNIFTKLTLPPARDDHRRVLAVLAYLQQR
ncbi:response regulator transcription factor [Nonomuraea typhae]|uniref:response regulator transcription factor n=1 Tax=Nonomuraea typhae TaxID=2603600 RepID=UPI0012F72F25|nr:response regulator transcription factor [Nonomuraea typhae]